jgi:hypothetical protein
MELINDTSNCTDKLLHLYLQRVLYKSVLQQKGTSWWGWFGLLLVDMKSVSDREGFEIVEKVGEWTEINWASIDEQYMNSKLANALRRRTEIKLQQIFHFREPPISY